VPSHLLFAKSVNFAQTYYDTEDLATVRGANMAPLRILHLLGEILTATPNVSRLDLSSSRIMLRIPEGLDIASIAQNVREWLAGDFGRLPMLPPEKTIPEHALLRAVGPHLSFVVSHAPETGQSDDHNKLRDLARWEQRRAPAVRVKWETTSKREFCTEDTQRPRESGMYSAATFARRSYGQFVKRSPDSWSVRGQPVAVHADDKMAQSFEEIVEAKAGQSIPRQLLGKLALIYIDGNGFSRIGAGETVDALEIRQAALERVLASRLRLAIVTCRDHGADASVPSRVQLELIRWGGDDMVLAVPADKAWRVASTFLDDVALGTSKFGFSIAAVVAPHKTPIRSLLATAGDVVLDRAKARAKRPGASGKSAFAYMMNASHDELPSLGSRDSDTRPTQCMTADEYAALTVVEPLLSDMISGKQRNELRTALRTSVPSTSSAADPIVRLRTELAEISELRLPRAVRATLGVNAKPKDLNRFREALHHWIELRHLVRCAQ